MELRKSSLNKNVILFKFMIVKCHLHVHYLVGMLPENEHLFSYNLLFCFQNFFFNLVSPRVMLRDSTVRALKGYKLSCSAVGTPPIQTKAMWNSTVMVNASNVLTIQLNKEGNYICEASNQFGTDKKEFSVKFAGKNGNL